MRIEVKGVNDVLMMKIHQDCTFEDFLLELDKLLDQPIFQQDGYFPKAFLILVVELLVKKK